MKITREILDNGMDITHVEYSKKDVAQAIKKAKEHMKKLEEERTAKEAETKA